MTEMIQFEAEFKEISGKGVARALRRDGKIPAVIYGNNQKPETVAISLREFNREYQKGGIRSRLVSINIGDKKFTAIPKEVQLDRVSDLPIHIDFLHVGKDTIIKVSAPVRIINTDKSPGLKKGGIVNVVHRSVELFCHPSNIPSAIEIDVDGLEIGMNVHMSGIKLPENVKPVEKNDFTVVSIMGRSEEDESPKTEAAAS